VTLFGGRCAHFSDDLGERTGALKALGTTVQLVAQLLLASLVHGELLAGFTSVGATFIARIGRFELAIGREQLACDEAEGPEEIDQHSHRGFDGLGTDAIAEVTQVILARDGLL
jgi:hypothetical protein